ncbi:hypothetical protein [Pedobacter sp. KLB.chiD]|uniref:hypothetical protein n=1 Tax=Pedobacter sp. KLB.chiD TaxID=3387402 RepID=UPI00399B7BC7
MENEENKKDTKQNSNHPKPTDDVQLEIETVIPSTEKETAQPGESVQNTGEAEDQEKSKSNDQVDKEDFTEKPVEETKTDGDDQRDDIETTTPSA